MRLKWLGDYRNVGEKRFCELGCGNGINLIELARRNPQASAIGYDTGAKEIGEGNATAKRLGLDRVQLRTADLRSWFPIADVAEADYVLVIDVLEHLPKPRDLAMRIADTLKPGASVLVSVPTPLYPRVVGRAYHESIGHVHDGFFLKDLDWFFSTLQRMRCRHSTGPLSWPGAAMFYRSDRISQRSAPIDAARKLGSIPFRFIDWLNADGLSCSVFAEYRKPIAE